MQLWENQPRGGVMWSSMKREVLIVMFPSHPSCEFNLREKIVMSHKTFANTATFPSRVFKRTKSSLLGNWCKVSIQMYPNFFVIRVVQIEEHGGYASKQTTKQK